MRRWIADDETGGRLRDLRAYYRTHPADFINDWGCTFDPRLVERGLPAVVPFLLFPKQREWCDWVLARWHGNEPGLAEKSRDCGASWLAVALSATLCLHWEGMAIGFGSRKEEYVDKLGAPKSLFWKAREFIKLLPPEFRPGWDVSHAPHMRISFPNTGSVMVGEAGDNIGRGDRSSIYFVDESAFLERPMLVEASLSQTTNCRIDISTPHGMANPFAQKRHSWPPERVFIFDWRDDPRKDEAWYAKQVRDLDPVTLAQEVDRSYSASLIGVLIPQTWARAAVDAHLKLGLEPSGPKRGALDVADEGIDLNAFAVGRGAHVENVTPWSGKGSDILGTVQRTFAFCDVLGIDGFHYDADGLGAGVRGDARAQAWFSLRLRFQRTHRAIEMHEAGEDWRQAYDPDDLITINGKMPELTKLLAELSQPTYTQSTTGKMVIDKTPDGMRSPNLADAVMILFAPRKRGYKIDLSAWST